MKCKPPVKEPAEDPLEKQAEELRRLTLAELREVYDTKLKNALIEQIQTLPAKLSRRVDDSAVAILQTALGLKSDPWNRWEVASDGLTPLGRELQTLVAAQLQLVVPDFVASLAEDTTANEALRKSLAKYYQEKLKRAVDAALYDHANKRIDALVKTALDAIIGDPDAQKKL